MTAAFADAYKGRRVLITGHTGFKGAWLCAWLMRLEAKVCGYSIDVPTTPSLFEQCGLATRMDHRTGDVRDTGALERVFAETRPDFVFHLAAQPIVSLSYRDPLDTISCNVLGTASVLQALRGVTWPCAAVFVASDKCYENVEQLWGYREIDPLGGKDVYSASKGAGEIIFHAFARSFFAGSETPVRVASARAGNVIGGGDWALDRIVADCIRAWMREQPVLLRRPESVRPWQHVLEPLGGYLALAAQLFAGAEISGESFNFGPPPDQPRTVRELLVGLGHSFGHPSPSTAYHVLAEPPFAEAGLLLLNCEKARVRLGWEPTCSFAETVQLTGEWYRRALDAPDDVLTLTLGQIAAYEALAQERGRAWMESAAAASRAGG